MSTTRLTTGVLALMAFLVLAPAKAFAHGDAILEGPEGPVAAGQEIRLAGSGFMPGERHRLILRGTLEDHDMGVVTADSDSTFVAGVRVPAKARPGQYRMVALAPDGDVVATLDLPVTAARETGGDDSAEGSEASGSRQTGADARADEMVIERSRTGIEWGAIGLIIGLAGGLGVGLLRRS